MVLVTHHVHPPQYRYGGRATEDRHHASLPALAAFLLSTFCFVLVGFSISAFSISAFAKVPRKIPDRLPTASQPLRLRVAGGALRPRKPIDSGNCGEKAEGSPPSAVLLRRTGRQNEEKRRGHGEIGGKRAKLNWPSRERRRLEYVAGGGQGGWPAMHSSGRSCQSATNWLARRNRTGPTGG